MTRKHFKELAEIIRPWANTFAGVEIALGVADMAAQDNEHFQPLAFFLACGFSEDAAKAMVNSTTEGTE